MGFLLQVVVWRMKVLVLKKNNKLWLEKRNNVSLTSGFFVASCWLENESSGAREKKLAMETKRIRMSS